jgi:hypothetical protein
MRHILCVQNLTISHCHAFLLVKLLLIFQLTSKLCSSSSFHDSGIYEFTFQDGSAVQGRYSFVYAYENGQWKISNHHSSIMPEGAVAAMKKVASMEK